MSSDRNPPNKKRRRSSSESQINVQNMVTEEPKERPDKVWEDPVEKLRLEAIFLPKFENEKNDHQIRNEMIQLVRDDAGYIEVTLKHSGSLVLWSGGQRFYSKNSISNQFTAAAEILLRQHFERSWRNSSGDVVKDNATGQTGAAMYEDCSRYLQEARLTCSFEVVTAVLGDHGAMPMKDYLILTAVADRSTEQFYSTAKLLELAQRFRLPIMILGLSPHKKVRKRFSCCTTRLGRLVWLLTLLKLSHRPLKFMYLPCTHTPYSRGIFLKVSSFVIYHVEISQFIVIRRKWQN